MKPNLYVRGVDSVDVVQLAMFPYAQPNAYNQVSKCKVTCSGIDELLNIHRIQMLLHSLTPPSDDNAVPKYEYGMDPHKNSAS